MTNPRVTERGLAEKLVALYSSGADDEAVAFAKDLLTWFPDNLTAWQVLGAVFDKRRRFDQAVACKLKAAELDRENPHSLNNLGNSYTRAGRFGDAVKVYRDVIVAAPDFLDGYVNLANALNELQQYQEAHDLLASIPHFKEKSVLYFRNLGNACKGLKLPERAAEYYEQGLTLDPKSGQLHSNLSAVLLEQDRIEEALVYSRQGVTLSPDSAEAHYNHGVALQVAGAFGDAAVHAQLALEIRPEYAEAHLSLGVSEHAMGHLQVAADAFESAISLRPDYADAHVNKGLILLLKRDFVRGFEAYRWRFAAGKAKQVPKELRREFQVGVDQLAGKNVFVHWEQGLGDAIQFSRCVSDVQALAASTTFCVLPKVRRLLSSIRPIQHLVTAEVAEAAIAQRYDFHIPLLDLPMILGVDPKREFARGPYVYAEDDRVAVWRSRIKQQGFKVGICWQGSTAPVDRGRSFPVLSFASIAKRKGVRLVSLHKGAGEDQLKSLPKGMIVEDYSHELDIGDDAFIDTAALMQNLDLVITSDTSIAHLAGALGLKTWVLLKFIPDWRWGLDSSDCFWYPTVRLFRQPTPGDWGTVFKQIEKALEKEIAYGR